MSFGVFSLPLVTSLGDRIHDGGLTVSEFSNRVSLIVVLEAIVSFMVTVVVYYFRSL